MALIEERTEVHTFGRTFGKAREYLVDALALRLQASVDNVRSVVEIVPAELPEHIQTIVDDALVTRATADASAEVASHLVSHAALSLIRNAWNSVRDAGELFGISHQRVQQVVSKGRAYVLASQKITGARKPVSGSPGDSFIIG